MQGLVLVLVLVYAAALVLLSLGRREGSDADYLLAGRRLTLPAFVATLVTTWYGGILGIGEYAWRFGISTWVVFGLPYYLAAVIFALWLAPRLRRSGAVTIPDLLADAYGRTAALSGAGAVYLATVPVAYLLMLGVLLRQATGLPLWAAVIISIAFSTVYVGLTGFRAVVRTDMLQLVLMYGGFLILVPAALAEVGGFAALWSQLPSDHRSWDGGLGWQTVVVWYLIALQTVVEPAFYQRVFAARDHKTARTGVLVSVAMWMVFDFPTVSSGLAARVLLPGLDDPMAAYPTLAQTVLSPLPAALFTLGLFATVMSTLDSYLFIAATTAGHDFPTATDDAGRERRRTRWGLVLSALLAAGGALLFESAVQVWHHVGSVLTAAMLLPVLAIHIPARHRPGEAAAVTAMLAAAATATGWIIAHGPEGYPLRMEPLFPALAVAACCLGIGSVSARRRRSGAR